MTEDELKHARELCAAATSGPWRADGCGYGDFKPDRACAIRRAREDAEPGYWGIVYDTSRDDCTHMMKAADAAFIAAARTLLPKALDEIERLRKLAVQAPKVACKHCPFYRHVHYEENGKLVAPGCSGFEAA